MAAMALKQIQDLLSRHYLFRTLDPAIMNRLERLAIRRRMPPGEVLFLKGDEGDALYGILAGRVRISTSAPNGKEVLLNIMEPGDIFGEIALLDGNPRTADATALASGELMVIKRQDFLSLLRDEPLLAVHLLKLVCERFRRTSERIEDAAFLSLPARLAKRLLSLSQTDTSGTAARHIRVVQYELAQMIGTTRESINRHLQRWRSNGWIEIHRGDLVVRDAAALRHLVEVDEDG
jgi:CRP/FNR family transcriptional regulator, cyclic AMP receptor protein